ncbi:MAG: Gfo/Idh/MocA family oxidoreductase [Lutibacter sp.]|nr:Gfo/Idh/MocA family oxidoreductase [Lutibacter sp.]
MKQIIQNLRTGKTILEELPVPVVKYGHVLIKTHRSLISLGTEKMLVEFGKSSLIKKARSQPEKVKQVLDKIKTEGLLPTLEAVFKKLDEPLPLGYCNSGEIIAIGEGVTGFSIGDRVASNGPHAEIVSVPKMLVVPIPNNVSYEEACFTVIGSIGLQGIRLVNPVFGETIVVIGLGLIGLITAEMLVASGCNVIGFDFDVVKVELAKKRGVDAYSAKNIDSVKLVEKLTNSNGADAVIITASTSSNDVISQAANMSRKKGRIVLVGVVGLNINRADFFKKELSFQVSCSYGPGRYDESYENSGIDYPFGYVRWTERRNFEAILVAIEKGQLHVKDLITNSLPLSEYQKIYENLSTSGIASILEYDNQSLDINSKIIQTKVRKNNSEIAKGVISIIGAGNFTKMVLLPSLKGAGVFLKYITSAGGLNAKTLAKKYGIEFSTTEYNSVLSDKEVDTVFITTRHNLHAKLVCEALDHDKHVFVEKPLALNLDELKDITEKYEAIVNNRIIHVGFNRRFSPHSQKVKQLLASVSSEINMIATINAGYIPQDVWVHDMKIGGGRIIGEACHFIDLMTFFSGSLVESVCMSALGNHPSDNSDNAIIMLKFKNGSQGVINYFSNGSKECSKERLEIFSQQKTIVIDNFRRTDGYGYKGFSSMRTKLNKGHSNQFKQFISAIKNGSGQLIPMEELSNTAKASFGAIESLKSKKWINL